VILIFFMISIYLASQDAEAAARRRAHVHFSFCSRTRGRKKMIRSHRASALRARATFPKRLVAKRPADGCTVQAVCPTATVAADAPTSRLFVRTLTGKVFPVDVNLYDTVDQLKQRIQDREGIPPDQQRLIWDGTQLDTDLLVCGDYAIPKDADIHLILRLRGGMYHATSGRLDMLSAATSGAESPKDDTMAITVHWAGHVVPLRVPYNTRPMDVTLDVRRVLRARGVPAEEYPLFRAVRALCVDGVEHPIVSLFRPLLNEVGAHPDSKVEFLV